MMVLPVAMIRLLACISMSVSTASAFAPKSVISRPSSLRLVALRAASSSPPPSAITSNATTGAASSFLPIFDFSSLDTVEKFDRIDDAIMGGISTSTLRDVPGQSYASWTGVCRLDGGGFCGMRTLPFETPLEVGDDAGGFYLDCRLASDDEPQRRVWKISTRTDTSRGEQVYQAQYELPTTTANSTDDEWARVQVPFSDFKLVRGPRVVQGGPSLNVTSGLYQIGLTMSKFVMSANTTELPNFRPGFFELHLQTIGVYANGKVNATEASVARSPITLSLSESKKKRPLLVKLLLPIAKMFFSEKSNRRKSAMRILTEERKLSRAQAVLYGLRMRSRSVGMMRSLLQTVSILAIDICRTITGSLLRLGIIWPVRLSRRVLSLPARILSKSRRSAQAETISNA